MNVLGRFSRVGLPLTGAKARIVGIRQSRGRIDQARSHVLNFWVVLNANFLQPPAPFQKLQTLLTPHKRPDWYPRGKPNLALGNQFFQ